MAPPFVLVHGGWGGGWEWRFLAAMLHEIAAGTPAAPPAAVSG